MHVINTVDVVVVNWNSRGYLQKCVQSVLAFSDRNRVKIRVVDNASSDGSGNFAANLSDVTFIQTGKNLGFGKACNIGALGGSSEFILFLNPDAELIEDAISVAANFLALPSNLNYGICGIRLIDEEGVVQRHCARFPNPLNFVARSVGLDGLFPSIFPPMSMKDFDHLSSRPVDHVIGAFYLIRRSVFENLGGFDERFFVYLEDLDMSFRALESGYQAFYLSEAQAKHKGGGTSENVKGLRLFYSIQSKIMYSYKHFHVAQALLVTLVTLSFEFIARLSKSILDLSPENVKQILFAYRLLFLQVYNVCKQTLFPINKS